jgi:hypothetical protein
MIPLSSACGRGPDPGARYGRRGAVCGPQRARILNWYLLAAMVTTVHLIARAVASWYTCASIGSRAD